MSDHITLYDTQGSPCARRVRIVLLEKGLAWETCVVDLTKMEQKRPEYLALNPNGVVPTLVHGDRVIYESNVITEYLDAVFPRPRLYPVDAWQCAQAKMWQAFELAMAKEFRPLMYLRVIGPFDRLRPKDEVMADVRGSTDDPAHIDWVSRAERQAVSRRRRLHHRRSVRLPARRDVPARAARDRPGSLSERQSMDGATQRAPIVPRQRESAAVDAWGFRCDR